MSAVSNLFPAKNRTAALAAFIRTFWQTVTGTGVVLGGTGFALTAAGLATINWVNLGYGVAAVVLSGLLAAGKASGNILVNGIPTAYATPTE